MNNFRGRVGAFIALAVWFGSLPAGAFAASAEEDITRPRLSLLDGEVSFWRPGNEDWTAARLNTPLAPGDALATGPRAKLEVQVGPQAYLRAADSSELALENQEPDALRFRLISGRVSLDVRSLLPGEVIEVGTPTAAVT